MGARYLSAVGLSLLVYDRLTHLDEEVADVWSDLRRNKWLKAMFLCGRLSAEAYMVYCAAVMGGFSNALDQKDCRRYIIIGPLLLKVSAINAEGVVICRLWSLWDDSRRVKCAIGAMAIIVVLTVVVATVLEVLQLPEFTIAADFLKSRQCLFNFPGQASILSMVVEASVFLAWDVFIVIIFTASTLGTPYQCSRDILVQFKRDGGRYFICLCSSVHVFLLYDFWQGFSGPSVLSLMPESSIELAKTWNIG
ncbi:hypothetical protein NP233_g11474 [Leucocoprinus birnbaumii]|uniref:Uncharacterized protein n=1 Tax=Leucocoprinus birnbaumii TaxID=56174 RepID=A0AAD5VH37_9AGAR|nr:hypothetical protein NP233_g11474 [Leucocoprinus birnbaumii]